jgi:hypothetical protein
MRCKEWIAVAAITFGGLGLALAGEHCVCDPPQEHFLERLAPVGGCNPYGGGILCWWNPKAFPRGGAPDDYHHKPLPRVCWPPYPRFFQWGPPEVVNPCGSRCP